MRKLAKKRDSAKDAADYGAPRPFHHNAGPITGGLVSRPRPGVLGRALSVKRLEAIHWRGLTRDALSADPFLERKAA